MTVTAGRRITPEPRLGSEAIDVAPLADAAWPEDAALRTADSSRGTRGRWSVPLLVAAAVTLIGWARLPWEARKVVWAEDGHLFLGELLSEGFWGSLFKPYTGYLQFWPRALTEVALQTGDLGLFADRIAFISCAAVGAMAAGVFVWSRALRLPPWSRAALAALPVLVSSVPIEVLGNVANLHWFVIWATAFLIVHRPATWVGAAALAVLGATFSMTELQVAMVLPLVLIGLRDRRTWLVRGGVLAGLLAQGMATAVEPRTTMTDHLGIGSTVLGYLINGPLSLLVGDSSSAAYLLSHLGWAVAVAALVPFAILLAYVMVRAPRALKLVGGTTALVSVVAWVAASYVNLSPTATPGFDYSRFDAAQFLTVGFFRYGFVPSMCLLGVTVLAATVAVAELHGPIARPAASGTPTHRPRAIPVVVVVLAAAVAVAQLVAFTPASSMRSGGARWVDSVQQARSECAVGVLRTREIAEAPGGWSTTVPCAVLDRP